MDSSLVDLDKRIVEKDKRTAEKDKRTAEKDKRTAEKDKRTAEKDKRRQIRKSRSDDYHTRHRSRSSPSKSRSRPRKHSTRGHRHKKLPPLDLTGSRSAPPYVPESYDDRLTWSSYAPSLQENFIKDLINKPPKYKKTHQDKISLLENLRRKIEVLRVAEPYLHRLNQNELKRSVEDSKISSTGDVKSVKKTKRSVTSGSKRQTLGSESESIRDSSSKFSSATSSKRASTSKHEVVERTYAPEQSDRKLDKHKQGSDYKSKYDSHRSSAHKRSSHATYKKFDKRKDSRRSRKSRDASDQESDREEEEEEEEEINHEEGQERCRRNNKDGGCIDEEHPSGMSFSQFRDVLMKSSCSEGADLKKSAKQLCEAFCKDGGGCKIFSQE